MLDLLTVGPQFTRPASRAAAAAIDRYLLLPRPTSAANPSVAAAAVDRRDRQTDGRTLDRFVTFTAYYAHRVIMPVTSQEW